MTKTALTACLVALAATAFAVDAGAATYKWVDKDGKVHYSDQPVAGAEIHRDVGPTEAIDRLLGVTDHEQPAGKRCELLRRVRIRRRSEQERQVELDGIGVLELVEQDSLVAAVQGPPGRRRGRRIAPASPWSSRG